MGYNYVEMHGRRMGLDLETGRVFAEGVPFTFTMTPAAGTTNQTLVTIQAVDYFGKAMSKVVNFDLWLSDATTGAGLTATTASGTVAAGASGADIGTLTSKKALRVQTNASGVYILAITDLSKTAFKVCASVPDSGVTVVGATLATGNYG